MEWYLGYPIFWTKMSILGAAALFEMAVMYTLIKWRVRARREQEIEFAPGTVKLMRACNTVLLVLMSSIVLAAAFMARGVAYPAPASAHSSREPQPDDR